MVRTYDPKQVAISIGGYPISGFADGTFIRVERDEAAFTKKVGCDGETSRAKTNNRAGTVTLTLMQTSSSNDALSSIALLDETSNAGVVPVLISDLSGRSTFFSANGWIEGPVAAEYGKELGEIEWKIAVADLDVFIGGNPEYGS